jgi:hypothetical protein
MRAKARAIGKLETAADGSQRHAGASWLHVNLIQWTGAPLSEEQLQQLSRAVTRVGGRP